MMTRLRFVVVFAISCAPAQEPASGSTPALHGQREVDASVAELPRAAPHDASTAAPVAAEEPKPAASSPSPESTATAACIAESKISRCLPLFGKSIDDRDTEENRRGTHCTSTCIGERAQRLKPAVSAAEAKCKEELVRSKGRARPSCKFPKTPRPRDDREVSMRFQDALRAAIDKRSDATARALDDTLKLLDAKYFVEVEPDCTETCRFEGAAALQDGGAPKP